MENRDLLSKNSENIPKSERNGLVQNGEPSRNPPDGGFRAYMVVVGSFLTNGLIFGIINSYSIIFTVLKEKLKDEQVTNYEGRAGKKLLWFIYFFNIVTILFFITVGLYSVKTMDHYQIAVYMYMVISIKNKLSHPK